MFIVRTTGDQIVNVYNILEFYRFVGTFLMLVRKFSLTVCLESYLILFFAFNFKTRATCLNDIISSVIHCYAYRIRMFSVSISQP